MKVNMVKISYPKFSREIDLHDVQRFADKFGFELIVDGLETQYREGYVTGELRCFLTNRYGTFELTQDGYSGLLYEDANNKIDFWHFINQFLDEGDRPEIADVEIEV